MKTEDLIAALAADSAEPARPLLPRILMMLAAGIVVSIALFIELLEIRPDILDAVQTWRFDVKIAIVAVAAVLSTLACLELARPTARPRATVFALLASLFALAVMIELIVSPADTWQSRMVGSNGRYCMTFIPTLSIAPLIALVTALRHGAPSSPTWAGVMAGLSSATIAATLYAIHCDNDSPLFVALWYSMAIGIVVATGALAGRLCLRW